MDFVPIRDPERTGPQLRALAMVGRAARHGLRQPQRAVLGAVRDIVFAADEDLDAMTPIEARALSERIEEPEEGRQVIRLMIVLALADGPPSLEQMALISSFSDALGVDEPSVNVVRYLAKGRTLRFRLAFFRHAHVRAYLRNTRRMLGGRWPLARALLVARGVLGEDDDLAGRFRALADLPEGTLGQQFHRHYTEQGLAFPGEKGGFPVGALFHDFSHVLAGYDTSPEGEMKNAAFQAGFTRDADAFFTMLFALLIHTAGVNLAPFPMPVLEGRIGAGALAWEVLSGLERGAAMPVDLGDGWDFWPYVELPIEVARARLGVPPRRGRSNDVSAH